MGLTPREVITVTRADTTLLGRLCPLRRPPTTEPVSHWKSVQLTLLVSLLVVASLLAAAYLLNRETDRQQAARQALTELQANADVTRYLGTPVTIQGVTGD